VAHEALHAPDGQTRLTRKPAPVQLLRHAAELDSEVAVQVSRFDLAPLLLPEPGERALIAP
jgi:hypothetical protein